jgi:hypothetical protein
MKVFATKNARNRKKEKYEGPNYCVGRKERKKSQRRKTVKDRICRADTRRNFAHRASNTGCDEVNAWPQRTQKIAKRERMKDRITVLAAKNAKIAKEENER